jgi:hypothetical protein
VALKLFSHNRKGEAVKKALLAILCTVLMSTGSVKVFAQTATTTATTQTSTSVQPLSSSDVAQIKGGLKVLAQGFGIETPATATTATTATTQTVEEHKTIGDVGDKALDMVGKAVASISATLEKVAPHVWKIMIKQQYAKAVGGLIVPWGLLFLLLPYWQIIRKAWKTDHIKDDSDEYWARLWLVRIIPGGAGFIITIVALVALSNSIMLLVNPEYYAVKDLITMLLGQSPK